MKSLKFMLIAAGFALFFISAFFLFEPGNDPTGFFVYTPSIAVLNTDNNAEVGAELEIEFMTKGEKDLSVAASRGVVEFIGLECGEKRIDWSPSRSITYKGYSCRDNSKIIVRVLSREAEVIIGFGEESQIAKNSAS